jgi:transcriptional regulator with XRE-family HTH domain
MSRSTTAEIAGYLQWRVREEIKAGKTATELAKLAGVSGAQISELKNRGIGAGWQTAEGLARVFGMTMPELLEAAAAWTAKSGAPPSSARGTPRPVAPAQRRALAADLAREDGVSNEAIASVLKEPEDLERSTIWWILRMRRRDLELAEQRSQDPPAALPLPERAAPEESGEARIKRRRAGSGRK